MRASVLIKAEPVYRREAFVAGLKACGYRVETSALAQPAPGDVLVVWNRYGQHEQAADRFEAAGGTVLVAENGYLDPGRHEHRAWYALAIGGHNGQGRWPVGTPERWPVIAPRLGAAWHDWRYWRDWRTSGTHVLVCPSRSFGRRGHIMPADWAERTAAVLRRHTQRPVRIRPHPGNGKPPVPLQEDLRDCWAVVIWYASAGVHALLAGIPVICCAPAWILKDCCSARLEDVDLTLVGERASAFERLAWAQWHVEEIASGAAFRHVLPATRQGEVAGPA